MKTGYNCLLIAALALFVCLVAVGHAQASCVYNNAHTPIDVNFGCGTGCHNNWTIHPTYYKCRPGMGGEVAVRVMDAYDKNEIDDGRCKLRVDEHGWVSVHQHGKKVTVISKHSDGSMHDECHMNIVGDPN